METTFLLETQNPDLQSYILELNITWSQKVSQTLRQHKTTHNRKDSNTHNTSMWHHTMHFTLINMTLGLILSQWARSKSRSWFKSFLKFRRVLSDASWHHLHGIQMTCQVNAFKNNQVSVYECVCVSVWDLHTKRKQVSVGMMNCC